MGSEPGAQVTRTVSQSLRNPVPKNPFCVWGGGGGYDSGECFIECWTNDDGPDPLLVLI